MECVGGGWVVRRWWGRGGLKMGEEVEGLRGEGGRRGGRVRVRVEWRGGRVRVEGWKGRDG